MVILLSSAFGSQIDNSSKLTFLFEEEIVLFKTDANFAREDVCLNHLFIISYSAKVYTLFLKLVREKKTSMKWRVPSWCE